MIHPWAGLFNRRPEALARPDTFQRSAANAAHAAAKPAASGASATGASAASITANDFLTLLISELKNQDPTAQTDPTAYVNQLVQVNSLQQLIQINQNTQSSPAASTAGGPEGAANAVAHALTASPHRSRAASERAGL